MFTPNKSPAKTRAAGFWLRPAWWMRALTFWWVPAMLGACIALAGARRLLGGGVASSWRGLREEGATNWRGLRDEEAS